MLLGDGRFDLHSFENRMNPSEGTGGELVRSVCGLTWVDSLPVFNSAIGKRWANVQTNASFTYQGTASSFDMSISCQAVSQTDECTEVWFILIYLFYGLLAELSNRQAAAFSVPVCSIISLSRQNKSQWKLLIEYLMQWWAQNCKFSSKWCWPTEIKLYKNRRGVWVLMKLINKDCKWQPCKCFRKQT